MFPRPAAEATGTEPAARNHDEDLAGGHAQKGNNVGSCRCPAAAPAASGAGLVSRVNIRSRCQVAVSPVALPAGARLDDARPGL